MKTTRKVKKSKCLTCGKTTKAMYMANRGSFCEKCIEVESLNQQVTARLEACRDASRQFREKKFIARVYSLNA